MFRKIGLSVIGIGALIAVLYPIFHVEKPVQSTQEIRVIQTENYTPLITQEEHEEEHQDDDSELDLE